MGTRRWPDTIRLEQKLPDVQVRSIEVTNGGSGYTSAPTVTVSGTATAVATINANGQVNGIAVTANGGELSYPHQPSPLAVAGEAEQKRKQT